MTAKLCHTQLLSLSMLSDDNIVFFSHIYLFFSSFLFSPFQLSLAIFKPYLAPYSAVDHGPVSEDPSIAVLRRPAASPEEQAGRSVREASSPEITGGRQAGNAPCKRSGSKRPGARLPRCCPGAKVLLSISFPVVIGC